VAESNATSVSLPKDEVVTITVNIDAPGLTEEEADEWKKDAESVWNEAFDQWPAQCYKLKLTVKVNPQPGLVREGNAERPSPSGPPLSVQRVLQKTVRHN
jgi:hypothetical protein